MINRRYKVDLSAYLAECELNYLRLLKLLPQDNDNEQVYRVRWPNQLTALIKLQITERCKYTTMVKLVQQSPMEWLNLSMELRLYSDVRTCGITDFQGQASVWPSYSYPNRDMYQPDEQFQQQKFLSQCLAHCLEYGLSDQPVFALKV